MATRIAQTLATNTQQTVTRTMASADSHLLAAVPGRDSVHLQNGNGQANGKRSIFQRFADFFRQLGRTIKNLFKRKEKLSVEELAQRVKAQLETKESDYKNAFLQLRSLSTEQTSALQRVCIYACPSFEADGTHARILLSALNKAYKEAPDKTIYTKQVKDFINTLSDVLPDELHALNIPERHHEAITQQIKEFKEVVEALLDFEEELGEFKSNIHNWHNGSSTEINDLEKMLKDPEKAGKAFVSMLGEIEDKAAYKAKVELMLQDQLDKAIEAKDTKKQETLKALQDKILTHFIMDSNIEHSSPDGKKLLPLMITINRKNEMLAYIRDNWAQTAPEEQDAFKAQIQSMIQASETHLAALKAESKEPNSDDLQCFERFKTQVNAIFNPPAGWTGWLPMAAQYGLPKEMLGTYGSSILTRGFDGYFNSRPLAQVGRQVGVDAFSLALARDFLPNSWWNPIAGGLLGTGVNYGLDRSSAVEYWENWVTGKTKGIMPQFLTNFWNTLRS